MISPTYGRVNMRQIAKIIFDYIRERTDVAEHNHIVIGTDSQNHKDETRGVIVIAVYTDGKGGKFFYEIQKLPIILNLKVKIHKETELSIAYADQLIDELTTLSIQENFDYEKYTSIGIHVDAGYAGPSGQVIPEIVGWLKGAGYEPTVKPDSFVASTIADRISK